MLWGVVTILLFSSCSFVSDYEQVNPDFIYNGLSTDWMTFGGDRLYSRVQNPAQMIDLQTDKSYDLVRDPFFEENEQSASIIYIFSDVNNFYYLLGDGRSSYKIIQQNHETLNERIIYKKNFYREQKNVFLGALKTPSPDASNFYRSNIPNRFAVFENTLFLFLNDSIQAINLKTRKETVILEESIYNGNYSYYKGELYFVSSSYDIYVYNIHSGELMQLEKYKAQFILVTPKGIFFSSASDKGRLHWIDFNYQNEKIYTDKSVNAMDFNREHLYYLSEEDSGLYRMNLDGSENQKISDITGAFDIFCARDQHTNILLYTDESGNFAVHKFDEE